MNRHKLAGLLAAGLMSLMVVACGGSDPDYGAKPSIEPPFVPGAGIAPPRFAYVVHSNADSVSGYSVDATSGVLTPMGSGSPWATGSSPVAIAVDPLVQYAYVANSGAGVGAAYNSISIFTIDTSTGVLTSAATPVAAGSAPMALAMDPQGLYLYVASAGDNTVRAYRRLAGGGLSAINLPFALGLGDTGPRALAVDRAGKFVYVANFTSSTITIFSIDTATTGSNTAGALTYVGSVSVPVVGAHPNGLVISPSGKILYVTNETDDSVMVYTVNATTGGLTYKSVSRNSGATPTALALEPNGRYAYVSNRSFGTLSSYSVSQGGGTIGNLTPLSGAAATTTISSPPSPGPTYIAADPSGTFVYSTHLNGGAVSGYKITATGAGAGALTPITGSPFAAQGGVSESDFILVTK